MVKGHIAGRQSLKAHSGWLESRPTANVPLAFFLGVQANRSWSHGFRREPLLPYLHISLPPFLPFFLSLSLSLSVSVSLGFGLDSIFQMNIAVVKGIIILLPFIDRPKLFGRRILWRCLANDMMLTALCKPLAELCELVCNVLWLWWLFRWSSRCGC